jgi:hypothetical protein
MAIVTYLDTSCLIAVADAERQRADRVFDLLDDPQRAFVHSAFTTLETLPLAIHYRNKRREQFFRLYINLCAHFSNNLPAIMDEANRQATDVSLEGNKGVFAALIEPARKRKCRIGEDEWPQTF